MAILGIVAEYNPFHNGHLYLLEKSRQQGDFSATVVVMSGNFLQRGEPAFCDKWAGGDGFERWRGFAYRTSLLLRYPQCYYFAKGQCSFYNAAGGHSPGFWQ